MSDEEQGISIRFMRKTWTDGSGVERSVETLEPLPFRQEVTGWYVVPLPKDEDGK